MPVSVNKLTVNTKVSKEGGEGQNSGQAQQSGGGGGGLSKIKREELIQECLDRVEEMLDYRLNP
jgi:hypothetical protein